MQKRPRTITVILLLAAVQIIYAQRAQAKPQAQSPAGAKTVDCTLDGKPHTCSRADLLQTFAEAHTIALESQPKDRIADGELASFARSLAKDVVPASSPADLTLRLVHTPPSGVSVGSFDQDLATLRVFSTGGGAADSHLLWVETYRGQPDIPWPAVVRALARQLQATIAGR